MIEFNDKITIPGCVQLEALAYVNNCNIDSSRITMSGFVTISLKRNEPDYASYNSISFKDVPYDSSLETSPASQFYSWLMTQPQFEGGTIYPPRE